MRPRPEEVLFFASATDLRHWLEVNHDRVSVQWIGYYKKASGRGGLTYAETLDEALCVGWIDGQLSGLDEHRYAIRWTPRRPGSIWSAANVKRVGELIAADRMQPAGLAAFQARTPELVGGYVSDMDPEAVPDEMGSALRTNEAAWRSWSQQPPSYRRQMMWWVLSAKRAETRARRLAALIAEHAAGRRIDPLHLPRLRPD